jgi:hypothetical protein
MKWSYSSRGLWCLDAFKRWFCGILNYYVLTFVVSCAFIFSGDHIVPKKKKSVASQITLPPLKGHYKQIDQFKKP